MSRLEGTAAPDPGAEAPDRSAGTGGTIVRTWAAGGGNLMS
jgi:hypothetical protein